jgi:glutathione synthase/RimK-type ligase-like ATP-grasp enzyme
VSPRTVLLWGIDGDAPIADVRAALKERDCRVVFLDQRQDADVDMTLSVANTLQGALRMGDEWLNLSEVSALYLRPFDPRELPSCAGRDGAFDHALAVQDTLMSWAELTPALVLNRPSHMAANNSKPYQARWIESLGFRIPQTLLTTDPAAARAFLQRHGRVIYKSISGVRSIVSRVSDEHLGRFENIASCPTQFQEFIDGREYRVHVVGETVIATEIVSNADDYRYAVDAVMRAATLPDEVAMQCRVLARAMRLSLAGMDIRCSTAGEWYCFEVNPSPGYTFFEHHTGQPIAHHIARLLAAAGSRPLALRPHTKPSTQTSAS